MAGSEWHLNSPMLNASSGVGYVTNIGGLNSYVSGSPFSIFAILLVSDIFGFTVPLFRELADKVAATGYFVVAPDFFNGDPFDSDNVNRPLPVWIQDHEPEKGFEAAKPVIEALKSQGFSAVGVAGFCWGGKTASALGKSKHVKASVLLHPTSVEVDDIRGENDTISPPELILEYKQVLQNAIPKVDYYVKIFPNVSHGWTVSYDPNDPKAVKAAEKAHKIMIYWFHKHLKEATNLVM
ncbi:unnamed protein product [Sphenostylis stenocarpa]|uniref:Dienelactone hydrolase domain-containing protein n=1 Tax=Sphenostylis stenocarpa TaxID=92480 RepID=A0AA86SBD3_9FABA|nr:unnamed protein product [Sphenostylis stenocarpa]